MWQEFLPFYAVLANDRPAGAAFTHRLELENLKNLFIRVFAAYLVGREDIIKSHWQNLYDVLNPKNPGNILGKVNAACKEDQGAKDFVLKIIVKNFVKSLDLARQDFMQPLATEFKTEFEKVKRDQKNSGSEITIENIEKFLQPVIKPTVNNAKPSSLVDREPENLYKISGIGNTTQSGHFFNINGLPDHNRDLFIGLDKNMKTFMNTVSKKVLQEVKNFKNECENNLKNGILPTKELLVVGTDQYHYKDISSEDIMRKLGLAMSFMLEAAINDKKVNTVSEAIMFLSNLIKENKQLLFEKNPILNHVPEDKIQQILLTVVGSLDEYLENDLKKHLKNSTEVRQNQFK